MNADEFGAGGPILPGSPLARALDDYAVPPLSAGFADRVLAAAETRSRPLPELRRPATGGGRGWRVGRRIAVAALGFGALASAAAATGLLERFDIPVPSPEKVWASLTGKEQVAAVPLPAPASVIPADPASASLTPVAIEGPVDTPEELAEVFRRIDEVRQGRIEARRAEIDQRIDAQINRAIERRRAAGLPVPTPEEEASLRERIAAERVRREQATAERIAARREELRQRVENGEALTRKDVVQGSKQDPAVRDRRQRLQQLRQMSPEARRELLRQLPPEERRALTQEYRQWREERRSMRIGQQPASVPNEPLADSPASEVAPDAPPMATAAAASTAAASADPVAPENSPPLP